LRGGSNPLLCTASDDHCYVIKFLNNQQSRRCVVNDLFASLLAREIGLPVPQPALITITPEFVKRNWLSPKLKDAIGDGTLHFGSRVPVDPNHWALFDHWPKRLTTELSNLGTAAGCWLFDVWTANGDGFQYLVHWQRPGAFRFWKLDHGFCFLANHWTFQDTPRIPGGWQQVAMQGVARMTDFEPYLSRIKALPFERIRHIAEAIPRSWLGSDWEEFETMLFVLADRADRIEEHVERCWPQSLNGELLKSPAIDIRETCDLATLAQRVSWQGASQPLRHNKNDVEPTRLPSAGRSDRRDRTERLRHRFTAAGGSQPGR
jgi:hypothetical protein